MLREAINFNQPLEDWNVRKVDDMYEMFRNAFNFNQCLGSWAYKTGDGPAIINSMLLNTACSIGYNATPSRTVGPWCQYPADGCTVDGLIEPSNAPSFAPSDAPSFSSGPSNFGSEEPSSSVNPSNKPSEEPSLSFVPSNKPSDKPSLSNNPTMFFPCMDNPEATSIVGNRKNKRTVKTCNFVRNNPSKNVCNRGKKKMMFREQCPTSCKLPLCTCKDSEFVVFKNNNGRRFRKRCSRIKIELCSKFDEIFNLCPKRCKLPKCEGK